MEPRIREVAMTTTDFEAKARELCKSAQHGMYGQCFGCDAIAAALRDAHNEAIEAAACETGAWSGMGHVRDAIRALKVVPCE